MAISVCVYDILKWETAVMTMLLSNSKAQKYFAKSMEVVVIAFDLIKKKSLNLSWVLITFTAFWTHDRETLELKEHVYEVPSICNSICIYVF